MVLFNTSFNTAFTHQPSEGACRDHYIESQMLFVTFFKKWAAHSVVGSLELNTMRCTSPVVLVLGEPTDG